MRNARSVRAVLAVVAAAGLAGPGAAIAAADDCANAQFRPGAAANLPDCRAWEQVSPLDKGGNDILNSATVVGADNGDAAFFYAAGAFAGAETVLYETGYLGTRGGDGWATRATDPPFLPSSSLLKGTYGLSEDGTKAVVSSSRALAPGAIEGGSNLYIRDLTQPASYRLVFADSSPSFSNEVNAWSRGAYVGGNADLSAMAFSTTIPLVSGAPEGVRSLYLWNDGKLSLASRLPDGTYGDMSLDPETPLKDRRVLSEDGTRVWFEAAFGPSHMGQRALYQYVEGQGTTLVSRSHRSGDDPSVGQNTNGFKYGSADGRTLFFLGSSGPLTDETVVSPDGASSGSIYRWTADDDRLVDVTAQFAGTPEAVRRINPDIRGVSPDGRIVWFTSAAILTPDAGEGAAFTRLYALDVESGQLHYVLRSSTVATLLTHFRFSPDGRTIAVQSFATATGEPNANPVCQDEDPSNWGRCGNVFTWRFDAPSEPATCVSCGPAGMVRQGPAATFGQTTTGFDGRLSRAVLDDGRVFFDSADGLVPSDGNGVRDVYEYRPGRGVTLLTPGTSGSPARFTDATEDGGNVFFVTDERLVAQDRDVLGDLYTARVGGGIAAQHQAPREPGGGCAGEACRPSITPPLPPLFGGTPPLQAPVAGPSPSFRVRAPSASALRTAARTGRLLLPVTVTDPGTIRATMTGTVAGKRNRTVARASRKATRATTYRLSLRLTKTARNELRRKGRLRVRLAVEYSEGISEYRRTVTLTANRTSTSKKGGSR